MALASIQDLYVHELQDIYSAEKQILSALPRMAQSAKHTELRQALQEHEQTTQEHVRRLETIFGDLGVRPGGSRCKGMAGLLEEGEDLLSEDADPDVRDAAVIGSAQRVEHYEIAAYGTARTFAGQLGLQRHADLLQRTLDEEGETDRRLTRIAESRVNQDAQTGMR